MLGLSLWFSLGHTGPFFLGWFAGIPGLLWAISGPFSGPFLLDFLGHLWAFWTSLLWAIFLGFWLADFWCFLWFLLGQFLGLAGRLLRSLLWACFGLHFWTSLDGFFGLPLYSF